MFRKELTEDNELLLYRNGQLIYKRWLNTGQSKVFDVRAYDKYTLTSITDLDIEHSNHLIHVTAELKLRTTEEGGRETAVFTGYRPNHVFEYRDNGEFETTYIGDINFDRPEIKPGETTNVLVRFLLGQRIEQFMEIGREWFIHEGKRVIGTATILAFELPTTSHNSR